MTSRSDRRLVITVCALPALLASLLTVYWLSVPLIGIGGDEPHYQILAASLIRDRDLDLRNNYAEDEESGEIFGRIEPHVYRTDAGWMPYHTPGLGFVLAVPFAIGGQLGSRIALSLFPVLLAAACVRWFGQWVTLPETAGLAAGTVLSLPAIFGATAFLAGPLSLAWFHYRGFGTIMGGRGATELSADVLRGLELFLGLHFDQAQGMLFQHPLLVVAGLVSLGIVIRARPTIVLPWSVLYLSLIVPNAMQLARYGGGAAAGRFGWSAIWLWLVPVGFALARHRADVARFVRPAVVASLVYQLALATRWLPEPGVLFPALSEVLAERNSLFPVAVRGLLPSYYFWDYRSYLTYPQNLVWLVVVSAFVGLGFMAASRASVRRVPASSV